MALLLFVILFIVMFFTIAPKFLSALSNKLTQFIVRPSVNEHDLKEELKTLKQELCFISMVDEFPKYARAERKINKLKSEIQSLAQNRREVSLKMKLGISVAFHILQVVVFICLIYNFHHKPVIALPAEWFFPVGSLISFPTAVSGAVGTAVWIFVCRSAVSNLAKFI